MGKARLSLAVGVGSHPAGVSFFQYISNFEIYRIIQFCINHVISRYLG